ncbi:hypothetical protein [Prosthecochloris sp. HL-130-GSB]|uniref:hypothetical protein n=1 Tax=Prosthecochloris sp. HL-130-GSB TaxID=1974213 RepID=UPI0012F4CE14|nr:hypothetical protein [Prosthecochloris sp. HL-130-GSB]
MAAGLLAGSPSLSAQAAAQTAGTAAAAVGTVASAGVAATGAAAAAAGGAVRMASAAKTGAELASGAAKMGGAGPLGSAAAGIKGGTQAVFKGAWDRTGGKVSGFVERHAADGAREGFRNTGGSMKDGPVSDAGNHSSRPRWAEAARRSLLHARNLGSQQGGDSTE